MVSALAFSNGLEAYDRACRLAAVDPLCGLPLGLPQSRYLQRRQMGQKKSNLWFLSRRETNDNQPVPSFIPVGPPLLFCGLLSAI
jgi:hypothetical protein